LSYWTTMVSHVARLVAFMIIRAGSNSGLISASTGRRLRRLGWSAAEHATDYLLGMRQSALEP